MDEEMTRLRHEDPDEFARRYLDQVLASDKQMKVALYSPDDPDLPERVVYIAQGDDAGTLIVPAFLGAGPNLTPAEIVATCCGIAHKQLGPPFLVAFMAEAYMQIPDQAKEVPRRRGVLTRRFHEGDPTITECLMISIVHRRLDLTLRSIVANQPYHYEGGNIVFGEPMIIDSLDDDEVVGIGAVPEAMAAAFGGRQN